MYSTVTASSTVRRWLWHGVLDGEAVALALDPRPVDEHARVGLEPRARQRDVGVEPGDLAHGPA
jgi:hypothetical protein